MQAASRLRDLDDEGGAEGGAEDWGAVSAETVMGIRWLNLLPGV
jgi:hypothetical protein